MCINYVCLITSWNKHVIGWANYGWLKAINSIFRSSLTSSSSLLTLCSSYPYMLFQSWSLKVATSKARNSTSTRPSWNFISSSSSSNRLVFQTHLTGKGWKNNDPLARPPKLSYTRTIRLRPSRLGNSPLETSTSSSPRYMVSITKEGEPVK